jgi:hypothetical protein
VFGCFLLQFPEDCTLSCVVFEYCAFFEDNNIVSVVFGTNAPHC